MSKSHYFLCKLNRPFHLDIIYDCQAISNVDACEQLFSDTEFFFKYFLKNDILNFDLTFEEKDRIVDVIRKKYTHYHLIIWLSKSGFIWINEESDTLYKFLSFNGLTGSQKKDDNKG